MENECKSEIEKELDFVGDAIDYISKYAEPGDIAVNTAFHWFSQRYDALLNKFQENKEAP